MLVFFSDPISSPVTEVANFWHIYTRKAISIAPQIPIDLPSLQYMTELEESWWGNTHWSQDWLRVFSIPGPQYHVTFTPGMCKRGDVLWSLVDKWKLSLKHLSWKVTMLLALSCPSRSADLALLDLSRRVYKPDGACFYPSALSKQSRQISDCSHVFFPSLVDDLQLCPVATHKVYEERTQPLRGKTKLLAAIINPHKAISLSTVARCLKSLLEA